MNMGFTQIQIKLFKSHISNQFIQGNINPMAPLLIFGINSLFGGVLALTLPETKNKTLPNTVQVKICLAFTFNF